MTTDGGQVGAGGLSASRAGLAHRAALGLGLGSLSARRRLRTVGALALVTWVPLLLLTLPAGLAFGTRVEVPLLRDPGFYGRYVVALPLLVFAEVVVAASLVVQTRHLHQSGLVPEAERPRYEAATAQMHRLYGSWVAQGVILILSYVLVITLRTVVAYSPGSSSWERLTADSGDQVTPAGWWSILVCLPILMFLLVRWLWRACVWDWFLFRVSRLDLELTPTHPDRAGGLSFLAWGQASFGPVLAAVSAILSGGFAAEVLYGGESLNSLKYHLAVFLALSLGFLLAPLAVFSGKLARCRFRALLDFGALIWRHDRAFDEKWIRGPGAARESLLGSPDVSSLSAIGEAFEHVKRMRVVPLDEQALIVLTAAALVPMLPFLGSTIPLTDILQKLVEFMV
jgi:hypothetical protein